MKLNFDYHNHTALSRCSRKDYTATDMLWQMKAKGYEHAGLSDHYYFDETVPAGNVRTVRQAAAEVPGLDVYAGVEVDMLWPGHLDASGETLSVFDYVSVACPHWHNPRIARPVILSADALAQEQYDMLLSLAEMPCVDVVVHPFTFYPTEGYLPVSQEEMMERDTTADIDRLIDGFLKNPTITLSEAGEAEELELLPDELEASPVKYEELPREEGVTLSELYEDWERGGVPVRMAVDDQGNAYADPDEIKRELRRPGRRLFLFREDGSLPHAMENRDGRLYVSDRGISAVNQAEEYSAHKKYQPKASLAPDDITKIPDQKLIRAVDAHIKV